MILVKNFSLIPETGNYCKKNTSHVCHVNTGSRNVIYLQRILNDFQCCFSLFFHVRRKGEQRFTSAALNRFEVFRNLRDPSDDKFEEKSKVALLVNFSIFFYFLWRGRFAAIISSLAFICLLSR